MKTTSVVIGSIALGASLLLAGCNHGAKEVIGNQKARAEVRRVDDFSTIAVNGAFQVKIASGQQKNLSISADSNVLPYITTTVANNALSVGFMKGVSVVESTQPEITISTPKLGAIDINGASHVDAINIKSKKFSLNTHGASTLTLSGKTQQLSIASAGSATIDTKHLKAADVKVKISGVGKVAVNADKSLDVDIAGVGKVSYTGQPKLINKEIQGQGRVIPEPGNAKQAIVPKTQKAKVNKVAKKKTVAKKITKNAKQS